MCSKPESAWSVRSYSAGCPLALGPNCPHAEQERRLFRQESGGGKDLGGLDGLLQGQIRENGRQTASHHRFTGARNAAEQQIMSASRGNLHGPLGIFLALDIGKIDRIVVVPGKQLGRIDGQGDELDPAGEKFHRLIKPLDPVHLQPLDNGSLGRIGRRDEKTADPFLAGRQGHGQHPGHRPDRAVQGELAGNGGLFEQTALEDTGRRQNTQGNGQVVAGPLFLHRRRRQIDRDPPLRKFISRILDGGPHPVLGLAHRSFRLAPRWKTRAVPGPDPPPPEQEDRRPRTPSS